MQLEEEDEEDEDAQCLHLPLLPPLARALGADDGQGDASQCTEKLQVENLRADGGQSDVIHSTGTQLMQENYRCRTQ